MVASRQLDLLYEFSPVWSSGEQKIHITFYLIAGTRKQVSPHLLKNSFFFLPYTIWDRTISCLQWRTGKWNMTIIRRNHGWGAKDVDAVRILTTHEVNRGWEWEGKGGKNTLSFVEQRKVEMCVPIEYYIMHLKSIFFGIFHCPGNLSSPAYLLRYRYRHAKMYPAPCCVKLSPIWTH